MSHATLTAGPVFTAHTAAVSVDVDAPGSRSAPSIAAVPPLEGDAGPGTASAAPSSSTLKALSLLELVAQNGGATATEIKETLGFSLPTVYRLAQLLVDADYLVHLREERRFELGYKVHELGRALHQQLGVSPPMRAVVQALHEAGDVAAYFAVYRGTDVVVAHVADSARAQRIRPLEFGFHEATHATAFGKIILAGMSVEERDSFLDANGMPSFTDATITSRDELERHLERVRLRGVAWEREEFVPGHTCAAVGVRSASGEVIGAVALSLESPRLGHRSDELERLLRGAGARASHLVRRGR
ncbi:IclR family transcriptional regulator [Pseudoclavibacter sp. RFBB5]|uniref:IclR family transcriptional regulator n=1 Tax=Pseudoclavibacter sp. RFBB5 TaxID=2080574 RepID=UPI000CE72616|nr:IclR family transcriptional regulator [Pseudoclavibacter sp. RFBB5]PPG27656.1 IclR family transcriptional regulator [Pseudoclavibacter sp. RFBB5]